MTVQIPAEATVVSREMVEYDPWTPGVLLEQVVFTLAEPCGCVAETTLLDGELVSGTLAVVCDPCAEAAQVAYEEAEMKAEHEAEMACERYWENRGYDEARLQEEMEARMGIMYMVDQLV